MECDHDEIDDTNNEDEGSSELNEGLDKNVDAEEDFEFCYNCHSWEHNTLNCTIKISKKGTIKNVQVEDGEQAHSQIQCTKSSLPTNMSTHLPNSNTSKTQKISDKVRPKIFPISIKFLKDKKNDAKNEESDKCE